MRVAPLDYGCARKLREIQRDSDVVGLDAGRELTYIKRECFWVLAKPTAEFLIPILVPLSH